MALILDDGRTPVGLESTVLDLSGEAPALLRPGGVTLEALTEFLGPIAMPAAGPARSPGMLPSHYAPSLPLRLEATGARPGEALLAFGPDAPPGFAEIIMAQPHPATSPRPPPTCSQCSASSTAPRSPASRSPRSPNTASAMPSTTACAAPPPRGALKNPIGIRSDADESNEVSLGEVERIMI